MSSSLTKTGDPGSGTVKVLQNNAPSVPLILCGEGTTTSGALTLTPLALAHNEDSAQSLAVLGHADPCTDYKELGATATSGGLRDPFNPFDFYDVDGDRDVDIDDISAVAAAFLTSPPNPLYTAAKDRGPQLGPNYWNVSGPNGFIDIDDITAIAAQHLHSC